MTKKSLLEKVFNLIKNLLNGLKKMQKNWGLVNLHLLLWYLWNIKEMQAGSKGGCRLRGGPLTDCHHFLS